MKLDKEKVIIEKPINSINNDVFGAYTYSNQLYNALNSGAKFIAIDGKYGTGKSSVLELLRSRICNDKISKRKNKFVNINFININEKYNEENKNETINKYHRYFVNQVGESLYKNPYNVEKTFYNNLFSYTVISLKNNTYKKIINIILYGLIILLFLYLTYGTFFKDIILFKAVYDVLTNFMPWIILIIFTLLILYGYGFYKPDKEENSPMLDIDRCKNNLCKVLYNTIPKNGIVYFVIDDLDRIPDYLQLDIISLLYNEYYNLDKSLKNIKIKFIFMIDLDKLDNNNNSDINKDKLFDYILTISNKDPLVLRNYIENEINNNKILNEIFNNINNKDYVIGLITNNYNSVRKVKHLFNRIITKYVYLNDKEYNNINYSELVIICILMGLEDIDNLRDKLNELIYEKNNNLGNSNIDIILNEVYEKDMIDNNYYIYLSNFIKIDDLLNPKEQEIYEICNYPFNDIDDWNKVYDILEKDEVKLSKIYNQIYKYLPNKEKILLLGDENFYNYVKNNYGINVSTIDIYKHNGIYIKYNNYIGYDFFIL